MHATLLGALVLGLLLLVLLGWRALERRRMARAWQSLRIKGLGERFHEGMVAAVPEPARRYLLHGIALGTPLASSVELQMRGRIRTSAEGAWMPMRGKEILAAPDGFIWSASAGGLLRIAGSDSYTGGKGAMQWRLWDLVPVVNASGEDTTRSARGRLAAEAAIWLPSTLLPERGTRWESVNRDTVKAVLTLDGEDFEIYLSIAPDGALRKVVFHRWGSVQTKDGEYGKIPFGGVFHGERTLGGYTIPSKMIAGWWIDTNKAWDFFEAEITAARYL